MPIPIRRPSEATPEISVIVPTCGRPDALARLLNTLARQTVAPSRFEVGITDDGSRPPVAPRLETLALPFRWRCEWQEQAGPAAARNRAIAHARAPLLLILNDDAGAPPDLIERHLAAHAAARTTGGPARAWLGGFDFAPDCNTPFVVALTRLGRLFPFDQIVRGGPNPGRFFWTCNVSVPRAAVVEAGGFDPSFRDPVGEDVDLGLRLAQRGVAVWYLEGAACLHHHRFDVGAFVRRQVNLGRAVVRLWRKHGDPELLPWIRGAQGNEARLAAALESQLPPWGVDAEVAVARIETLDRGAPANGPAAAVAMAADAVVALLPRVDRCAFGLGVLAGLRGLDADQALRWLAASTSSATR